MRESMVTPAPVTLDSRQQSLAERPDDGCGTKLKVLYRNPSPGAPIRGVVQTEHDHGRTTKGMNWSAPGEETVVRTTKPDNTDAAKSAAHLRARKKKPIMQQVSGCGGPMDHAQMMAEREPQRCVNTGINGGLTVFSELLTGSFLLTGHMEVFNAKLWAIGLALDVAIEKRETVQMQAEQMVAVISDYQPAIG